MQVSPVPEIDEVIYEASLLLWVRISGSLLAENIRILFHISYPKMQILHKGPAGGRATRPGGGLKPLARAPESLAGTRRSIVNDDGYSEGTCSTKFNFTYPPKA
jgi:hypothetical protein